MTDSLKVIAYIRVSTLDKQHPESQSLEIREYCQRRGWKIVAEFTDRMSGTSAKRPGLDAATAFLRRHRTPIIVISSLSRLGRTLHHVISLGLEFDKYGTRVVSIREDMDFSSTNGKLMFGLFAAFAAFERDLIAERIRTGLSYARYRGQHIGRPRTVDHTKIASALQLLGEGRSIRSVARELHISSSSVHKIFKQSRNPIASDNATAGLGTEQFAS